MITNYEATGAPRMSQRRMWFYAITLGLCFGGLVLLSLLSGGHPFTTSAAASFLAGGLAAGWIVLLSRLRDRYLAGRLAHGSFIFAAVALPVTILAARDPRYLAALPLVLLIAVLFTWER